MGSFSLMNIGTSALLANQAAMATTGHNIANVNTPGYSRQATVQVPSLAQYSGGGYVGRGVDVVTVARMHSDFLATNATLAKATSAADGIRATKLGQLEQLFPIGANGLGAAVNNVFSAFTDMASTPTDITARTALVARLSDMTARFNATSSQLDDLQTQVNAQMQDNVTRINSLATQIASVNQQILNVTGSGHDPNDLLDQRDNLINSMNQYVQTSTIAAADGTLGVFIAGGQPIVLGSTAAQLKLVPDATDSKLKSLVISQSGQNIGLNFQQIGGGELSGLLRFETQDLNDARNTVGRMALGIANVLNNQHKLGLDLNGAAGGALFNIPTFKGTASPYNTSGAAVQATVNDPTGNGLQPSDYLVAFAATGNTITRLSDGTVTAFTTLPITVDGLDFAVGSGTAANGDKFTIKPGATAAQLTSAITAPQKLAATPLSFAFGTQNTGTLTVGALAGPLPTAAATQSQNNPYLTSPVTITFTSATTFDVSGDGTGNLTAQVYPPVGPPAGVISFNGWSLTLAGTPAAGDVVSLQSFQASADTRTPLLGGVSLSDAYATALATVGTTVQGAKSASALSTAIASDAQTASTSAAGVNLDEEAAKLLQFQQSYQASAKILQVAQSIFDTLLQTVAK